MLSSPSTYSSSSQPSFDNRLRSKEQLLQDDVIHDGMTVNNIPQIHMDKPGYALGPVTRWNNVPEKEPVRQKWSPRRKCHFCAIFFCLIQVGALVYAAFLIRRPYLFPILKNPFPKYLTIPIYNFVITIVGSILSGINLFFWTQLGAGYLVKRLCDARITYRFYDRCIHWARGSIHFQASLSLLISLLFLSIFKSYAAAFTAAFGVNPVAHSYPVNIVLTNLSANADALATIVGAPRFDPAGNDFDLSLSRLGLAFSSNYTLNQMSPFLVSDGFQVQGTGGMVLGALIGATTVPIIEHLPGVDPKVAHLLSANYGTNVLHFAAAGVRAATRCAIAERFMTSESIFFDGLTLFNISTPSCGQITRAHAAALDLVYDAYSCPDISGIIPDISGITTGIIRTSPSNGTIVEAMECSTTLSDALGSGVYVESLNEFTLDSRPFEFTQMIPKGVLAVGVYTNALWIQTMGRSGSQGLLSFIQGDPLSDPTVTSKMEDAISYLHALGGAKLIDNANTAAVLDGAVSPYISNNTTVEIVAHLFQIGYGQDGAHKYFITFLAVSVVLALASAICMIWYPPMPFDPTDPLSMMLLALNSPQTELLNGASVGQLPVAPWKERMKDWFVYQCCGRRRASREVEQKLVYEGPEFQLEADPSDKHLQLIPYEKWDGWQKRRIGSRPPIQGESYS